MESIRGAEVVAIVFKGFAILTLVGGIISAIAVDRNATVPAAAVIGIVLGAVIGAATLAFFGYVLDLLMDIRASTGIVSDLALDDEDEEEPGTR